MHRTRLVVAVSCPWLVSRGTLAANAQIVRVKDRLNLRRSANEDMDTGIRVREPIVVTIGGNCCRWCAHGLGVGITCRVGPNGSIWLDEGYANVVPTTGQVEVISSCLHDTVADSPPPVPRGKAARLLGERGGVPGPLAGCVRQAEIAVVRLATREEAEDERHEDGEDERELEKGGATLTPCSSHSSTLRAHAAPSYPRRRPQ